MNKTNQIAVTVKFFATLRAYGPTEEKLTIPEKSPVQFLFDKYQIPEEERRAIIMINGKPHQDLNTILKNGDIIAIFPPIGGG
jgi:molybdopterin synthase sulfur carrier subunit